MAPPRNIRPGVTYMITRRCYQRTLRLRPCERTNQIFLYCLALAAEKTGVAIHAACLMSDHHHTVLTDVEGRLPEFTRELHRLCAKAMNACQAQRENLWSAERCHALELGDEGAVIDRIAYLAANPVQSELVASPDDWPGVMRLPDDAARVERVARPDAFGARSGAPAVIELRIVPPAGLKNVAGRVAAEVERRVEAIRASVRSAGRRFLGRAAVLATSMLRRATTSEQRGRLVPQIAASSVALRTTMLAAQREFRRAYHDALERWRGGFRAALFPHGTWWMRVFHGASIEGAGPQVPTVQA